MIKISVCQFKVGSNKQDNILHASKFIDDAITNRSDIIVLPECFVVPYNINKFEENAEIIGDHDSSTINMLKNKSRNCPSTYIFASIIEKYNDKLYNTCLVLKNGVIITTYKKMNLYKINLEEHSFCEADVLTPGKSPTIVETEFGNIGIGICYDLRFNSLAKYYQENNCKLVIYPGSFNRYTGPCHWQLLQQARALDNQLFIVSCSTACTFGAEFESYGKSFVISPWGSIVNETKLDEEEVITISINLNEIDDIRHKLPILK